MKSQLSFFDGTEMSEEFISPTGMNVIRKAMDEYAREYALQFTSWHYKKTFPEKTVPQNAIMRKIAQFEKEII